MVTINNELDDQLRAIEGLTWLPWIGKNYFSGERRLLIVAESHNVNGDNMSEIIKKVESNPNFTREVLEECPINREWSNKMFDNLHRTLFMNEAFSSSSFWDNVAFYNFIQRPMDYSKKERPEAADFHKGWSVFVPIVDFLKPTDCLFVGVSASNYFEFSMDALGVNHSSVKWLEGSSSSYGRSFSLNRPWGELSILGIQHSSKYFSYEVWHSFLMNHKKKLMRYIYSLASLNNSPSDVSIKDVNDKLWLKDVPSRKHKSILACDYSNIDFEGTDALYLTVGRAQYDNESSASVKFWRWSERAQKWSRQSEEVPVERVGDMALILVSAIKTFQTLDFGTGYTYLNEGYCNEEDMCFLKKCIHENAPRIRQSLSELKRLLNDIDLNKI